MSQKLAGVALLILGAAVAVNLAPVAQAQGTAQGPIAVYVGADPSSRQDKARKNIILKSAKVSRRERAFGSSAHNSLGSWGCCGGL